MEHHFGKAYCNGGTAPTSMAAGGGPASPPPGYAAPLPGAPSGSYAAPPAGYVAPPVSSLSVPQAPTRLYDEGAGHELAIMNQNRRKHALAWTYCVLIYVVGSLVIYGTFKVVGRRFLNNQFSEEQE